MRRSKRPGRSKAASRTSGLFVPANTMTPSLPEKPSISTKIWFKVCSRSELPPIADLALARPMASISSINMIAGARSLAIANRSLTRAGPTPTNISRNSDPEVERKGTPASPAVALASMVFPVPVGPERRAPFGICAPIFSYLAGSFKKLTNSMISAFASSIPATSENFVLTFSTLINRALDLPKPNMPIPPEDEREVRRIRTDMAAMSNRVGATVTASSASQLWVG
eukprot:Lithocolla_globosa_v1_NODE_1674_length_2405_cov_11.909787.p2 type:complete len:227 gc:universal NODE_1674_length_2405_cov_11.909787:1283-603(-)